MTAKNRGSVATEESSISEGKGKEKKIQGITCWETKG